MYAIITFVEEENLKETVAVVAASWIVDNQSLKDLLNKKIDCWWPPYTSDSRIEKAVRSKEVPGHDWTIYSGTLRYINGMLL